MVRFAMLSVIIMSLVGYGIWRIVSGFFPVSTQPANLVDRMASQTKLEQLLAKPTVSPIEQAEAQEWISCSDIRRVLTDTDRVYVGCRGGVLVTNLQGEVLRQYSQADGLTNDIVTDLALVGRRLFVGSQDGVGVIDLEQDKIIPLRVKDGLVNGSNISLAVDGNEVWVGTFDGVSRVNAQTLQIKNYRAELATATETYSVHRIFPTPKAVYISLISSAHSQGGLARFDKATETFSMVPSAQFFLSKNPKQLTSINYLNIAVVGEQMVLQDGDVFWLAQDRPQMNIKQLPNIAETLSQLAQVPQAGGVELLGTINSQVAIRFWADDTEKLAVLTPKSKEVRLVQPQDPAFPLVQAYSQARPSLQTSNLVLKAQRPFAFGQLLAAINDEVWLTARDGIWSVDVKTKIFHKRMSWPDEVENPDQVWLLPLVGTQQVLIGRQVCGMGCVQPDFWLVNLTDYAVRSIPIPDEARSFFQNSSGEIGALDYAVVSTPDWDVEKQQLVFSLPQAVVSVDLQFADWQLVQEKTLAQRTDVAKPLCHPLYQTGGESSVITAVQTHCPNQLGIMRMGDYAFKVHTGTDASDDWLSDGTGKRISAVAAGEPIYSPFPGWTDPVRVVQQAVDDEAVWLAHNRGIAQYMPRTNTWSVMSSRAGLPGQIVEDMILMESNVVALTRGGLVIIPK